MLKAITLGMRKKTQKNDYRYFPEPDLVPIVITDEKLKKNAVQYQNYKMLRLNALYLNTGLPREDAMILTVARKTADFLDATVKSWCRS